MDQKAGYYNEEYYKTHCGEEYERGKGWEEVFGNVADHIVREIQPHKVMDVGCAKGFLVEALRDRGTQAYGIDISEYAIAGVREDIRGCCAVGSVLEPIQDKYDLITCIEVLEHLEQNHVALAVQRLCEASDDILFSSTPSDYQEESHISVHPAEYWVEQFAYQGFFHDIQYDCSYISVQAMRFRKGSKTKMDLLREYEREIFRKQQEVTALRQSLRTSEENVRIYKDAYQEHVDQINQKLNPKIRQLEEELIQKEDVFRKALEKKTEEFTQALRQKDGQYTGMLEEYREKMQERYFQRMEEEIGRRKYYEEKYYEYAGYKDILEKNNIELEQSRTACLLLQEKHDIYYRNYNDLNNLGIRFLIRKKIDKKRVDRMLLKKGEDYWKPVFDAEFYAFRNDDIREKIGWNKKKLLQHFICYGMYEGRRANGEFDVEIYMNCNPDVVERWRFDRRAYYLHYIENGKKEGRRAI